MDEQRLRKMKRQIYLDRNRKYIYILFFILVAAYFGYQYFIANNFSIVNKSKEPIVASVRVFSPHSKKTKQTKLFSGKVIRKGKSLSTRFYLNYLPEGNRCVSIVIYGLKSRKNTAYGCSHHHITHY